MPKRETDAAGSLKTAKDCSAPGENSKTKSNQKSKLRLITREIGQIAGNQVLGDLGRKGVPNQSLQP